MGTNVTNLKLIKKSLNNTSSKYFPFFFLKKRTYNNIIQNGNITLVEETFLKLTVYNFMSRVFLSISQLHLAVS